MGNVASGNIAIENDPVEIVDFPVENIVDLSIAFVCLPEANPLIHSSSAGSTFGGTVVDCAASCAMKVLSHKCHDGGRDGQRLYDIIPA